MSLSLPLFLLSPLLLRAAAAAAAPAPAPAPALTTVPAPFPLGVKGAPTPTASILGVDAAGHTTFAIAEPLVEGDANGVSSTVGMFTATLVAGADYASETFAASADGIELAFGIACSFAGRTAAACDDGSGPTTVDISTVAPGNFSQVLDVVGPTPARSPSPSLSPAPALSPPPSGPAGAGKKSAGMRVRSGGVFGVAAAIGVLSAMVL
ncbi:hypothetical protein MIND_00693500 [Mycena indigotica]|uniref:Uncharacterized protein n=1 Tax=Mycena indigotica TaxID=2126181 RepID=A0A8H6SMC8_9AGAR|nr:uncharacterized protein MIND_00693500 [Mycena indigotica]KAF7301286.1 hypothetical protein MIND_00693500 [Mycena indigotica]